MNYQLSNDVLAFFRVGYKSFQIVQTRINLFLWSVVIRVLIWLAFLTALCVSRVACADDSCPEPMQQLSHDAKGKLQGDVETLLKLGKLKAEGDVDVITHDVLHEYQNADKIAVQQNILSIICNKVLASPNYSKEIKEYAVKKLIDSITNPSDKPMHFNINSGGPGKLRLLIFNPTSSPLNFTGGEVEVLGQPSQVFKMWIEPLPNGIPIVAFPPSAHGAVQGLLFNCAVGRESWETLYQMRYGNRSTLNQRQCKVCLEARTSDGDKLEPCEETSCSVLAISSVGDGCEKSRNPNAGVCRMPDGTIPPSVSPSGCVSLGGQWLAPVSTGN
jgi:hypothetical protein